MKPTTSTRLRRARADLLAALRLQVAASKLDNPVAHLVVHSVHRDLERALTDYESALTEHLCARAARP
jgi:hypothetical protein